MLIQVVESVPFKDSNIEKIMIDGSGPYWQIRAKNRRLVQVENGPACFVSLSDAQWFCGSLVRFSPTTTELKFDGWSND